MYLRGYFAAFLVLLSIAALAQKGDTVVLRWKINKGEKLGYKTVMEQVDAGKKDFSISELFKGMPGGAGKDTVEFKKILKELSNQTQKSNISTYLKKQADGTISVEMRAENNPASSPNDTGEMARMAKNIAMLRQMNNNIVLRGSIYDDGKIASFYTKKDQKNLLAVLFELPGKPVAIGDHWPIDINFISMDQNFACDSAYKRNEAKLMGVELVGNEHIATIKYDALEYVNGNFIVPFGDNKGPVKSMMKMQVEGTALFSIERGRWKAYSAIMSLSSTGIMTSETSTKLSLAEMN